MLDYSLFKTAARELNNTDGKSVVKVAGIINKLRSWLKQLGDSNYRQRVVEIGTKSENIRHYLEELSKAIDSLRKAINEADVDGYDRYLADVKSHLAPATSRQSVVPVNIPILKPQTMVN